MSDMAEMQERFRNLADDMGWMAALEVLQDWWHWNEIKTAAIDGAIHDGDVVDAGDHREETSSLRAIADDAGRAKDDFLSDIERLHEAICENRRDDAIDILNEMSEWRLRSVSEQRNLFPDRVPE